MHDAWLPCCRRVKLGTVPRDNRVVTAIMTGTPAHDILLPLLHALLDQAVASGIDRAVAVAVLIDLITSPSFDSAALDSGLGAVGGAGPAAPTS